MADTMRIAMGVEYDGSRFAGWQTQAHADTVQARVERALGRVADEVVAVTCAGRTDAGVHAAGQVIHFDTLAKRPAHGWVLGGTSNLPKDISLLWAKSVPDGFSARFSATGRTYRYAILNRRVRPAILRSHVTWFHKPLEAERMDAAAQALIGEHDFSSYRAVACQARHPRRQVTAIRVWRGGDYVYIDISANAFLHHMVRNIAGVLMAVGCGEQPISWPADLLDARDRTRGGVTAPAEGLYLVSVAYPPAFELPEPSPPPVFA